MPQNQQILWLEIKVVILFFMHFFFSLRLDSRQGWIEVVSGDQMIEANQIYLYIHIPCLKSIIYGRFINLLEWNENEMNWITKTIGSDRIICAIQAPNGRANVYKM